jgi:hypothetical protein
MGCDIDVDVDIFYFVLLSTSFISLLGCICILAFYWAFKELQGHFNTLVTYIAVTDIVRSFGLMCPCNRISSELIRSVIGVVLESTLVISIAWSACISITLYQLIVLSIQDIHKYHKYWVLLCFIFIPIVFIVPVFTDSYDVQESVCVFSSNSIGNIWTIAIVYVPGGLLIGFSGTVYAKTYFHVKNASIDCKIRNLLKYMMLYPIIMMIDLLPFIIIRIDQGVGIGCGSSFMVLTSLSVFSLNGAFNAVVFGLSNSIITKIRNKSASKVDLLTNSSFGSVNSDTCNFLVSSFVLSS